MIILPYSWPYSCWPHSWWDPMLAKVAGMASTLSEVSGRVKVRAACSRILQTERPFMMVETASLRFAALVGRNRMISGKATKSLTVPRNTRNDARKRTTTWSDERRKAASGWLVEGWQPLSGHSFRLLRRLFSRLRQSRTDRLRRELSSLCEADSITNRLWRHGFSVFQSAVRSWAVGTSRGFFRHSPAASAQCHLL